VGQLAHTSSFRWPSSTTCGASSSVEESAISLDGESQVTFVDLGPGEDAKAVQTILDTMGS
jgi:hypothetical protein